jgi:hypothetical protein
MVTSYNNTIVRKIYKIISSQSLLYENDVGTLVRFDVNFCTVNRYIDIIKFKKLHVIPSLNFFFMSSLDGMDV